jgi:hypothetical protein
MSWGGLILLILGMACIHTGDPYPGWRAVLPVAGTLLLMEGGRGAWVNRKFLSNPAVVWIGLISYPLYLFHWPALAFVHIVKGEKAESIYIIKALGICLLAAVITYHVIEKKIRKNKSLKSVFLLLVGFLATGILGVLVMVGIIGPKVSNNIQKITGILNDKEFFGGFTQRASKVGDYSVGGEGSQTLFVGDSNMEQYMPRIHELLKKNRGSERGAICIVYGGLPPIPNYYVNNSEGEHSIIPYFEEKIKNDARIDRVVIAALWPEYFIEQQNQNSINGIRANDARAIESAMNSLDILIRRLNSIGKSVSVVLTIPYGDKLNPRALFYRSFVGIIGGYSFPEMSTAEFLRQHGLVNNKVRETAIAAGAKVIDPMAYLSNGNTCVRLDNNGVPIRYDAAHLRPGYVKSEVKYLDATMRP